MENILVCIRLRPLSKTETAKGSPWKLTPKTIALSSAASTSAHTYNFDTVFGPDSQTADIYDTQTKKIISSAVQGFNGTIFAYGQTSSGKTFTMRGSQEEPGIIPLAIQDVFRNIEAAQDREFLLRVSYMEIYNEEIKDLLAPENCKLQIHENFERGIFVAGLREEIVVGPEQVLELMDYGEAHRHVGETNMNVHSSRSHAIFRMVIESRDRSQDDPSDRELLQSSDPVRVSHLNLVDLAGSERVSKTGAEGTRLKEGTHINKSLMTLGNVINKLSEGIEKQGGHVPYRDSKLTRILQPALGGNARTVIICNITPALVHVDESRGTLHFASRANRVTNCAQVNEIVTDAALLKRQKKEIAELRLKLQNQESPSDHEEEILNLRNELLKTELERERMALELQEFQKAQAERERCIKEQEQKIENLSTMVINSAVDDREFEKRSKRDDADDQRGNVKEVEKLILFPTVLNNRRETWCARPQSGLLLGPSLKRLSQKDMPKTPASEQLIVQINRERSFGLPPPFETLLEENEFTRGTGSCFDEGFEDGFSIGESFLIPEPGPQSSVADRRRRSSTEWIVANEIEQQYHELQGQYDTLQCDHVIKMNEKNNEIDKLRKELAYNQPTVSKSGKKDKHKKAVDLETRCKSLDGSEDAKYIETIKQLRAQVGNLETEKLYMERELQRLLDQSRQQSETSRQDLEEVFQELNHAKESLAESKVQLDRALQQVQQLQTEKRGNDVTYLQLSLALKDAKTEVDNIRVPSSALQSSINESLQLLTTYVKAFQECLADAKDLSSLNSKVYEKFNADLNSLTSKAETLKAPILEHHDFTVPRAMELDETYGRREVKEISSGVLGVQSDGMNAQAEHVLTHEEDGVQSLPSRLEDKLHQLNDIQGTRHDIEGIIYSYKNDQLQAGDKKDCEIKHCYSVSAEQKPDISEDFNNLQEERDRLHAAVDNLHNHIEHATSEKQSLLIRKTNLEEELKNFKTSLNMIEKETNILHGTSRNPEHRIGNVNASLLDLMELQFPNSPHLSHEHSTDRQVPADENWQRVEAELSHLKEEKSRLSEALASLQGEAEGAAVAKQVFVCRRSAPGDKIESLKLALQSVEEGRSTSEKLFDEASRELEKQETGILRLATMLLAARSLKLQTAGFEIEDVPSETFVRSGASDKLGILEGEVDWAIEELKILYESAETLQSAVKHAVSEEKKLLQRECALLVELDYVKASLQLVEDEKTLLTRNSEDIQHELDTIAKKIKGGQHSHDGSDTYESLSTLVPEVDRLIQDHDILKDRVNVLQDNVLRATKEIERLFLREASLVEEVVSLKSSLQEGEDDRKSLMRVSEERLAEMERQKVELDDTVRALQSESEDHNDAQRKILELNSLLSQRLEEEEKLNKRLKDVDEEKSTMTKTVAEVETQLQEFREGAAEALKEVKGWQQRYQTESAHHRSEITSLRKELSVAKALPGGLAKERGSLQRDLEKTKLKMKDIEAKLKTTIQDKTKLETEKMNMERELKQLRQSTLLQRDISRRDSIVDQRRQSIAFGVNKTKSQLSSVEHALQMKTDEVESLTYDLSLSHESYAKLEFAMAEAESYSKEKLAELEGTLAILKDEKEAGIASLERLRNELEVMNEQGRTNSNIVENLKYELAALKEKLRESNDDKFTAGALATANRKEKEDIVEELLDAHISFQRQKAELATQAKVNREKCNVLNLDIVLLTAELQKLKNIQEEASDTNRILQDKLHKALEANSEMSLSQHKLLKHLEADSESHKDRCRKLEQDLESARKLEHELRLSGSMQLEQLRLELQQCRMKLSTTTDTEQMLLSGERLLGTGSDLSAADWMENQILLIANTKLQVGLDASRDRLEIFEARLDDSNWELMEFKSLLQKAGFVRGDEWNLVSLQQFEKHMKSQNEEARRLEAELASKKMETIEVEVQFESMKAQRDKYQEQIQYLKTKVLTPEQEMGVRELVHQNKKLQAQLKNLEDKALELRELVIAKEASLTALQKKMGCLYMQNTQLQKDLAASKSELASVQQLHKIAVRAGALGKSTISSLEPVTSDKVQATSQSAASLPSSLFWNSGSPAYRVESQEPSFTQSSSAGYRIPLNENAPIVSPLNSERKRARLFPASERSKLSRTMGLGPRYFTVPPKFRSHDVDKENFTLH